jgi:hypothetical protein
VLHLAVACLLTAQGRSHRPITDEKPDFIPPVPSRSKAARRLACARYRDKYVQCNLWLPFSPNSCRNRKELADKEYKRKDM